MSEVALPVEFSVILPAFEMLLPSIVNERLLFRVQPLPELSVKLLIVPLTSSVTDAAAPVPVIRALLVLPGTVPVDQLPALLQSPDPAPFVKVSFVICWGFALPPGPGRDAGAETFPCGTNPALSALLSERTGRERIRPGSLGIEPSSRVARDRTISGRGIAPLTTLGGTSNPDAAGR
jgi:hypothetical protein